MSDIWLPGFQRVNSAHGGGGTMTDDPRKWVGHTVEGLSRDPAGQAAAHPFPPHCWVCLPSHPHRPRTRIQIVPLNRSAFALKHERGDPETNRAGAIQVEIEGFSAQAAGWSDSDLDWLATEVVGPMCNATGVKVALTVDTTSVTRMSWDVWRRYNGLCCHRNVPGNVHTDAPINLKHISTRLLETGNRPDAITTPPQPLEDDLLIIDPTNNNVYILSSGKLVFTGLNNANQPGATKPTAAGMKSLLTAYGAPIYTP